MRISKFYIFVAVIGLLTACEGDSGEAATSGLGQGGSMTRFAINGNYLYVVDRSSISVFDIGSPDFEKVNQVEAASGLETIFSKGQYLYLGALDAMYIYSISDPANPTFVFRYSHIVSCDPVVVQGNRAYVTLRSGTACNLGVNALEIIDITNPTSPSLITNYPLSAPHGLGVRENLLFVCEGEYGLTVLDITEEKHPVLLHTITDFHAYDVIVKEHELIVTGEDGIFQYSFTDEGALNLVSKIPVNRSEL